MNRIIVEVVCLMTCIVMCFVTTAVAVSANAYESAPAAIGIGSHPSIDANTVAFDVSEEQLASDLNGDGDLDDSVIHLYDLAGEVKINTGIVGTCPSISGSVIAFQAPSSEGIDDTTIIQYFDGVITSTVGIGEKPSASGHRIAFQTAESEYGGDIDGDGDSGDIAIRYYDIAADEIVNIGVAGRNPTLSGNSLFFLCDEAASGTDLNADGDMSDTLLRFCDISTSVVSGALADADELSRDVFDDRVAFGTSETAVGADLNGDGDALDHFIRYYDVSDHVVVETGIIGFAPSITQKGIAFATSEADGGDLNGDGDMLDWVLQFWDSTSNTITNSGLGLCDMGADLSIFSDCDLTAFVTDESMSESGDINGDGDLSDLIVRVVGTADVTAPVVTIVSPADSECYQTSSLPAASFSVVETNSYTVVESGYSSSEGAHTYTVTVTDASGNVGWDSVTYTVDNTPPTTDITLIGSVGGSGAYVSAVSAALSSSDSLCQVAQTLYSLDGGGWSTYVDPILIGDIGNHQILFYSIDEAGNSESHKSAEFSIEQNLVFDVASTSVNAVNVEGILAVILTDNSGNPVEGVEVVFSSSPVGLVFETASALTDSNGVARVVAWSGVSGVYQITASTSLGACAAWTLVVFDPEGMAAGGGWYYPLDDTGSSSPGTASFGFVAKYIKKVPNGNLEFQYHVDDKLNLKSTSITWLTISKSTAQFKGEATLNGVPGYSFLVVALDGTNGDKFSIKIWDIEGTLIHSSHNTLAGGNIIVRTKSESSAVGPAPAVGAGELALICLLSAVMTIGLRHLVASARGLAGNHRSKKQAGNFVDSEPRTPRRTRKLRLPCAVSELG